MVRTEIRVFGGLTFNISQRVEETDFPWDEDEPLEEGAQGYDVQVEVSTTVNGETFAGRESLRGIWILPSTEGKVYLDTMVEELTQDVLADLIESVHRTPEGT